MSATSRAFVPALRGSCWRARTSPARATSIGRRWRRWPARTQLPSCWRTRSVPSPADSGSSTAMPYAVLNDIADGGVIFSHLAAFYAHTYPDRLRAVAVADAERFGQELALARTEREPSRLTAAFERFFWTPREPPTPRVASRTRANFNMERSSICMTARGVRSLGALFAAWGSTRRGVGDEKTRGFAPGILVRLPTWPL